MYKYLQVLLAQNDPPYCMLYTKLKQLPLYNALSKVCHVLFAVFSLYTHDLTFLLASEFFFSMYFDPIHHS